MQVDPQNKYDIEEMLLDREDKHEQLEREADDDIPCENYELTDED